MMHKNTIIGLIGLAICFVVIILLLNLENLKSNPLTSKDCVTLDGGQTCHAKDPNPYRNYGTKTAYHNAYEENNNVDTKGCSPKIFYMLSRHATRYPDREYIEYINSYLPDLKDKIISSYENGKAQLCEEDINNLKAWHSSMKTQDENRLSSTGALEAKELGERFRKRFSELLTVPYSPDYYTIEYTSRNRTQHTGENFAKGLFTEEDYAKIDFEGKTNDKILQFHKDCKKIRKKCPNFGKKDEEIEKFVNGTLMQGVISSVSKRIGVDVSPMDVKHMYVACTFEYALNKSEAWCAVFSTDDLKVLEFNDDIDDYYKDGYGYEVNYKQACPVVEYVYNVFKGYDYIKENKAILHFTHSGGIKKVYSAFGLFRDDKPLTADNFCAFKNRKWRTSQICPFNTNIVFVLYDCNGEMKFITLHNESPVIIDGCDHKLCSVEKFYAQYRSTVEHCDITEICNVCKI